MGKGNGSGNVKAKAGYRFIPVSSRVVEPPLKLDQISHARPLPYGYCGTIEVTWTAETPICVGGAKPGKIDGKEVVTPFKLGDEYALPGASLKGMLRSIVEIITFSHLGQINSHHHFVFRDYQNDEYKNKVKSNKVKAGWLVYDRERKKWILYNAGSDGKVILVPIKVIMDAVLPRRRLAMLSESDRAAMLDRLAFNYRGKNSGKFYRALQGDAARGWESILDRCRSKKETIRKRREVFDNVYFNTSQRGAHLKKSVIRALLGEKAMDTLDPKIVDEVWGLLTLDLEILSDDDLLIAVLDKAVNKTPIPQEYLASVLKAVTINWKALCLATKNDLLAFWKLGPGKCSFTYREIPGVNRNGERFVKRIVDSMSVKNRESSHRGYLVCAGQSMKFGNKKYESIMMDPEKPVELTEEQIIQFAFAHSSMSRTTMKPENNWAYWLERTGYPNPFESANGNEPEKTENTAYPGIPVFYVGQPTDNKAADFYMGLSRVVKAPYDYSVGDVAANTLGQDPPYAVPKLEEQLDFARAIFGDVEEALGPAGKKAAQDPDRMALKGRMAFEFARADNAKLEEVIEEGVFMAPRASFWPFYLKDKDDPRRSASYNSASAILVGRKRYPVRQNTRRFIEGTENVVSRIQFLEQGAVFKGRIRFHNLHPVELGAVLWALLLPGRDGKCRHALGRAKGFGYGRLRCEINQLEARCNKGDKVLKESQYFIDEFEEYMKENLGKPLKDTPQVRALLAMSDPALGEKRRQDLTYLPDPKDFQKLKKKKTTLPDDYCKPEDWKDMLDTQGVAAGS